MLGRLIPFGYSAPGASTRLDALLQDEYVYLIDTRYSPRSRRPEWQQSALQARYGKRYLWLGRSLGNINYKNGGVIQLANAEPGLARLVNGLLQGYSMVLLCACKEYEQCHRRVIVEMLRERLPDIEQEKE